MTLIKSISGIRGTIGGAAGDNLTPIDVVAFTAAYGQWVRAFREKDRYRVVVGRDARKSGPMIQQLVMQTLVGMGIDVVNLGLSTTPTVEMAVAMEHADGGIVLTASHNPGQWNALKLLNSSGEFLSAQAGADILQRVADASAQFAAVEQLGRIIRNDAYIDLHIEEILDLPLVDVAAIKNAKFKIVVDGVNSSGGVAVPLLLEALGVHPVRLYCEPNGEFPHNPEPLEEHLSDLKQEVVNQRADLGFVVDPDVDRLAFVDQKGQMFGEEYTLVAVADYVLDRKPGPTVSNLSSSRALRDVTEKHGQTHYSSAVGEVNVVEKMKEVEAVIGGEGNGGVIYPALHYGRDSLVGIALFLSFLARERVTSSELRKRYPSYYMSKKKIALRPGLDVDGILKTMYRNYSDQRISDIDGVKIDFPDNWVHLRKSNTEPIIRVYTEASSQQQADNLAQRFMGEIEALATS